MNNFLGQLMTEYFTPSQQALDENRGGSSLEYTAKLRRELPMVLKKHKIQSIFDAGCNDCSWISTLIDNLDYSGGDISQAMVTDLQSRRPELNVVLHDVTTDKLPDVDLLFIKDVTIHLNNTDKKKIIQNWLSSNIPWIMITHDENTTNLDFNYEDGFPFAFVDWESDPWNFPNPIGVVYEIGTYGRCMALWHKDQICR